ncbi:HU family DNA-binding protein [Seohaeicola saemankumensis]|nr:HU family DNA-binding protein [Seohaeicola saemankumensis]MCA0869715.1 HU family DNA-binding protein [Seohaeicola saemankumensis]
MATSRKTSTSARKSAPKAASAAKKEAPETEDITTEDIATEDAVLAEPATPKVVTVSEPVVAEPDMKKKELIDLVVERSDIKKKFAKPVVEAMLAVLGEAIAEGRELNLQPLGKLRINRAEEKSNGRVIVCKIRQSLSAQGDDDDDDGAPQEDDLAPDDTGAAAEAAE